MLMVSGLCVLGFASSLSAAELRWANESGIGNLDPHTLREAFHLNVLKHVYEGLIRRDEKLGIEPALAERWENVSPERWRFHLRRDVKFHNGNSFDADDVVFSFQRARDQWSDVSGYIPSDVEVVKVDPFTVDFVSGKPYPLLFAEWENLLIMDREWAEEFRAVRPTNPVTGAGEEETGLVNYAATHANGTGAYQVTAYQEGISLKLQKNVRWWDSMSGNVDQVELLIVQSDSTRSAALIQGDVDLVTPLKPGNADFFDREEATGTDSIVGIRTIFLGMDQGRDELLYSDVKGKNPFRDIRVRKAFYHAIDASVLTEGILKGAAAPAASLIAPVLSPGVSDLKRLPFDPEKARSLLAEAGYPAGFSLELVCPMNRYVEDEKICQAIAAMLSNVGIDVQLAVMEKARFFKRLRSGMTSFYLVGWLPASYEGLNVLRALAATPLDDGFFGVYNKTGYSNARLDFLTREGQAEIDPEKRAAMIAEAFDILAADVAYIPLYQQGTSWASRRNVDVTVRPDNQVLLYKSHKAAP